MKHFAHHRRPLGRALRVSGGQETAAGEGERDPQEGRPASSKALTNKYYIRKDNAFFHNLSK